jgi:hypothetical protein
VRAPALQGNSVCKRFVAQATTTFQEAARRRDDRRKTRRVSRDALPGWRQTAVPAFSCSQEPSCGRIGRSPPGEQLTLVTLTCARSDCRDRAPYLLRSMTSARLRGAAGTCRYILDVSDAHPTQETCFPYGEGIPLAGGRRLRAVERSRQGLAETRRDARQCVGCATRDARAGFVGCATRDV